MIGDEKLLRVKGVTWKGTPLQLCCYCLVAPLRPAPALVVGHRPRVSLRMCASWPWCSGGSRRAAAGFLEYAVEISSLSLAAAAAID